MRRKLAQLLSQLDGSQEVSFSLILTLKDETPVLAEPTITDPTGFRGLLRGDDGGVTTCRFAPSKPNIVYGELARPEND